MCYLHQTVFIRHGHAATIELHDALTGEVFQQTGFLNATDLADYLVTKGLPFRSAYKISGELVAYCIAHNTVLEKLPLETFQTFSDLFDDGVYAAIDLKNCVTRRVSFGGTSVPSVEAQIAWVTQQLEA